MEFKDYVKDLGFADLYAMFQFVNGDADRTFGAKQKAKLLVMERHKIILDELNFRAYGQNPYELDKVEVKGEDPEKVLEELGKEND